MVELNSECEPLVQAARRLTASSAPSPQVRDEAQQLGASEARAATLAAWASLAADEKTSSALRDTFTLSSASGPRQTLVLLRLVASCLACSAKRPGPGHVYVTGIGKSGAVAQRLAISLRSVGIAASFVHTGEWVHGDLGTLRRTDVVIAFSHSGRTPELLHVLPHLKSRGVAVYGFTSSPTSPVAAACDGSVEVPCSQELLGAVPTRSIVAQEAACNMLISALVAAQDMTLEAFRADHPGGAIGTAQG